MNKTTEENDIHLKFFQDQFQSDEPEEPEEPEEEKEVRKERKKFLQIYKRKETYKKEQQILKRSDKK